METNLHIDVFGTNLTREHVIALIQLVPFLWAFWIYNRKAINQESAPSKATWILWSFTSTLNAFSYRSLSKDWLTAGVGIVDAFACTFTFLVVLRYQGTTKFTRYEKLSLAIGLAAIGAWYLFREALYANTILQIAVVVSFVPAFIHTWNEPIREPRTPWLLWTIVYLSNFGLVIAKVSTNRGSWREMIHPITYILLHGVVWALTLRKPKQAVSE